MPVKKHLVVGLVSALLFSAASRASADSVLELMPQDTLAAVVVRNFKASSEKIEKLGARLGQPTPKLVDFFKLTLGVQQGFNEEGDVLAVILPGQPIATVIALPVSDYKKFITQFEGADPEEACTKVRIAGQTALVGQKEGYAVFAEPEYELTLRKFLKSRHGRFNGVRDVKGVAKWVEQNDIAAFATLGGIQMASAYGLEELKKVEKGFEDLGFAGPDGESAMMQISAVFGMYRDMLTFFGQEITLAGVGLQIDEGNVHLTTRACFNPRGKVSRSIALADEGDESKENLLTQFPLGDYVFAAAGDDLLGLNKIMADWSVKMMRLQPQMYGFKEITDEQANEIAESMKKLGTKAMAAVWQVGTGDDHLYSGLVWAAKVENSKTFLEQQQKTFDLWNKLMADKKEAKPFWEIEPIKVDERSGLKIVFDLNQVLGQQAGMPQMPEMNAMFEKMFGPGGKLTTTIVAADETTILSTYASQDRLEKILAARGDQQQTLADDPLIAKTAALLLDKAQFRAYLNPAGLAKFVQQASKAFGPEGAGFTVPEFPADVPPIGFAAHVDREGFETDLVVPAKTLESASNYIQKLNAHVHEAQMGGL